MHIPVSKRYGILFTGLIICHQALHASSETIDEEILSLYQGQIPKHEIQALEFIQQHPSFDGRETVIAIFDTGVDPGAPGMQTTSTGQRKIVDIIDGSGAGDVDTSKKIKAIDGALRGLSGRTLQLPQGINNPSGWFRIGVKNSKDLFNQDVLERVTKWRSTELARKIQEARSQRYEKESNHPPVMDVENPQRALNEEVLESELKDYEKELTENDPGPYYDCVVWNDGENWNVIVDTDEDGNLQEEKILRPFGVEGEYASFPDHVALNFGVQVYKDGNLLSIVTTSGSHGTHVASIAAANFPSKPAFNGIAPGAQILSIRMGDVRAGGSSVFIGENRATATAAQYKVDVMNASWGGQSLLQNASGWGSELYNTLAEKYGVTAFVSVGNDGPALSTMGSPGGEAQSVIGVGAYVSPTMGQQLYSLINDNPNAMFNFSARGPARNGDLGIDLVAPGAAIAPLALDSVQGADLYNGTSMSAPSAAGVGALLISAAKQSDMHYSPARIKHALQNTAKWLTNETAFSQGSGLIQTVDAWEHLQAFQEVDFLDLFINVKVTGGRYHKGPGLYLRGNLPSGTRRYRVDVQPIFPDAYPNQKRYEFNSHLELTSDSEWLRVPEFLHLSSAGNKFYSEIDFSILPKDAHHPQIAFVNLYLTEKEEAGPVIRIPFTLIEGETYQSGENEFTEQSIQISSAETYRHFVMAPAQAQHLSLELERTKDNEPEKLFVLSALTLQSNRNNDDLHTRKYLRLKSGEKQSIELPVLPNQILEISLHQVWSQHGETHLALKGEWLGLRSNKSSIHLNGSEPASEITISSLNENIFELEGKLDKGIYQLFASKNEVFPGDRRGYFPAGKNEATGLQSFWLKQTFEIQLKEDAEVYFASPQAFTEFTAGGGIVEVYNEQGIKIAAAGAFNSDEELTQLPTGKLKMVIHFTAQKESTLEKLRGVPLTVISKIDPIPLNLYWEHNNLLTDSAQTEIKVTPMREHSLFLRSPKESPYLNFKNKPHELSGQLTFKKDGEEVKSIPITYTDGPYWDHSKKEKNPSVGEIVSYKKLLNDIYVEKVNFLKNSRANRALIAERKRLLDELNNRQNQDPQIWIEEIYQIALKNNLLHTWFLSNEAGSNKGDRKSLNELVKKIDSMINKCSPKKVAQYFGSKPSLKGASRAKKEKVKKDEEKYLIYRTHIAEAYLIACDAYLASESTNQAKTALSEARRWKADKSHTRMLNKLQIQCHVQSGLLGLALELLNNELEESPNDPVIKQWKKDIHTKLGWNEFVEFEELLENLSASQKKALP